ncbi:carbohydrate ABC transporter permease [Alicyclobacillus kakegawensis]|uniref:carbohydrate ABC transporter permease n=1 Tax=Alicyclobacillus kakegawensis TaxID=392012 RepID=UPI001FE14FFD|nr:sugar ABC transporter permease [Alicyclobacillus kakegawensis]
MQTHTVVGHRVSRRKAVDQALAGYLFVLPALASLVVFLVGPILYAFYISFQQFSFLDEQSTRFVGLANYTHLFHDPVFLRALWNTTLYSLGVVPVQTALALFLAIIVNRVQGKTFFRVAYYLPTVTSTVAVSVMFVFLFQPQGLVNQFLALFGVRGPNYFNSPTFALPAIMVMAIWSTVGQFMIIYLAGLQDIPDELYEAASMDGASGWKLTRYITIPMLRRTTFLVIVMSLIGTFQVFDQAYVVSGGTGGPLNATLTVILDLFIKGFKDMQMGYASAMAFVLFAIIMILTLIQHYVIGRED